MPVALITGGGGMLGRGAAKSLVEDGWQVVLADIDTAEAEKVAADLGGPAKAAVEKADAFSLESMQALAGRVVDKFGAIDGLVTAAGGIEAPRLEFADSKPEHWDSTME